MAADPSEALSRRVVIERVRPQVDGGRFPVKRTPGEVLEVSADIFADGHDVLSAVLRVRAEGGQWRESPMTLVTPGLDRWHGEFPVEGLGRLEYDIVAWADAFESWRHDLPIRVKARQVAPVDFSTAPSSCARPPRVSPRRLPTIPMRPACGASPTPSRAPRRSRRGSTRRSPASWRR